MEKDLIYEIDFCMKRLIKYLMVR